MTSPSTTTWSSWASTAAARCPEPMSDFNDVAFIERVGLSHSITVVTPQTEAATPDLPGPIPPKR